MASTFSVTSLAPVNQGLKTAEENSFGHHPLACGLVSLLFDPSVEEGQPGSVDEVTQWLESMAAELDRQPVRMRH